MSGHAAELLDLPRRAGERLRRRWLPSLLLGAWRAQESLAVTGARLSGLLRRPLHVECYYALDCPYGAMALQALSNIAARHGAVIDARLIRRETAGGQPEPAVRLAYELLDARRLARRYGLPAPAGRVPDPERLRHYESRAVAAEQSGRGIEFAVEALRQLWRARTDDPSADDGANSPIGAGESAQLPDTAAVEAWLARNRHRLQQRGHWSVPSVRIAGQWFLVHERLEQIDAWLARLAP